MSAALTLALASEAKQPRHGLLALAGVRARRRPGTSILHSENYSHTGGIPCNFLFLCAYAYIFNRLERRSDMSTKPARSSLSFSNNGRILAHLPNLHHNRREVVAMKSLIQAAVVAAALAAPVAVFAQANQPVTRAQVRAELIQLEKAGYNPAHGEDPYYPADLQAAEAKVAAQNAATGFGGVAAGSSDAGRRAISKADWNARYNHH